MPISSKTKAEQQKQSGWLVISDPKDWRHLLCRCKECGVEKLVRKDHLRSGKSTKCRKCGQKDVIGRRFAHLPKWLYKKLTDCARSSIRRCIDTSDQAYHNYGGRGIEVRFNDVISFVDHLITLPGYDDPSLVIDRIDNDGHYEIGNLRFTTAAVSRHNQRDKSQWK